MNEMTKQKVLEELAKNGQRLEDLITSSIKWCEKGLNIDYPEATIQTLKTHRREVRRVAPNILSKPGLCLFGASQAGKSNLAKSLLLNREENACLVYDSKRGKSINYNAYINPDGNEQEATGVMTRFVKYNQSENSDKFPVKIKLLSLSELVICLCAGWFNRGDFSSDRVEYDKLIQSTLDKIEITPLIKRNLICEDDIWSIKEYFEKHPDDKSEYLFSRLETLNYWNLVSSKADLLDIDEVVDVLSIFWYKNSSISGLFKTLYSKLLLLNSSDCIFGDIDLIIKQVPPGYDFNTPSSTSNIVDVNTLLSLNANRNELSVFNNESNSIRITADYLSAISKEVIVFVNQSTEIINNYDILDFPGARKVNPFTLGTDVQLSNDELANIFLRGKVEFLFYSYSDNYQINTLVIATSMTTQRGANSPIPKLLKGWVENYIGKTQSTRQRILSKYAVPPLFIAQTFWNDVISKKKSSDTDSPYEKIISAFNKRFGEDLFSNNNWHLNWTSERFKNFYLIRDFEFCSLYTDPEVLPEPKDAYENLEKSKKDYFDLAKKIFSEEESVCQNFHSASISFEKASSPNLDGTEFFIENLLKLDALSLKTDKYSEILKSTYDKVITIMEDFTKKEDKSAQIEDAIKFSTDIDARLSTMPSSGKYSFAKFQESFTLTEQEVYNRVHSIIHSDKLIKDSDFNEYWRFIALHIDLKPKMGRDLVLTTLMAKHHMSSEEELLEYLSSLNLDFEKLLICLNSGLKKKSTLLVESIYQFWLTEKLAKITSESFPNTPLNNVVIKRIINVIKDNFERLDMIPFISNKIKDFVDNIDVKPESFRMIADIITGYFNKFAMSIGWAFTPDEDRTTYMQMSKDNDVPVFSFSTNIKNGIPNLNHEELCEIFNFIDNYQEKFNSNDGIDIHSIERSPVMHNLYKWQDYIKLAHFSNIGKIDYDIDANNELIDTLEEYSSLFCEN